MQISYNGNLNFKQGRTRMRGMILFEHYTVSMFLVKREQESNKVRMSA